MEPYSIIASSMRHGESKPCHHSRRATEYLLWVIAGHAAAKAASFRTAEENMQPWHTDGNHDLKNGLKGHMRQAHPRT